MMSFSFPKCWDNDERMNVLFQPFRDRKANPQAYDAKIKFWKDLILNLFDSDLLVPDQSSDTFGIVTKICEDDLCKAFSRKGIRPKCLDVVIQELLREGLLSNFQTYRSTLAESIAKQRASWPSWGYQVLISSPMKSLTGKVVAVVSPKSRCLETVNYAISNNVKEIGLLVLNRVRQQAQSGVGGKYKLLLTRSDLDAVFRISGNNNDLDLALLWLESEKRVYMASSKEYGEIYKFSQSDGEKIEPLSDVERGVLQIQQSKCKLDTLITSKQLQINQLLDSIKEQLAKNNRVQALRILRRRKLIEKSLDKDVEHAHKLDCILDEIYGANTIQFVLQAYDKGAQALKTLNDSNPIDMVEATMDKLSETLANSEDVSNALSTPLFDEGDDKDLEQELKDILGTKGDVKVDDSIDDLLLHLDQMVVVVGDVVPGKGDSGAGTKPKLKA